jgi:hypothetical protein
MYRGVELGDLGGCGVVVRSWDMVCAVLRVKVSVELTAMITSWSGLPEDSIEQCSCRRDAHQHEDSNDGQR